MSINLTTDEYTTTDIVCAALLLERGCEIVGIEDAGGRGKRSRFVFDNRDGQAQRWATMLYMQPDDVMINLPAYRNAQKTLFRLIDQYCR